MATKMKAAVCFDFEKPLVIEDIWIDEPRQDEVKIKVSACGICHSDVLYIAGAWGGSLPNLFGHEIAGTVVSTGDSVEHVKTNDRVAVSLLRSCGSCFYCQCEQWNQCEHHFETDEPKRLRLTNGISVNRGLGTGGFAEYALVHKSQVIKIPDMMNMESAALITCGVVTGYGAVANTAQITPGEHVVVVGVGGVGINCIQAAKIKKAATIVAIDISEEKLEFAKHLGATHTINSDRCDETDVILGLSAQRGADAVIVATGNAEATERVFRYLRPGGKVVLVGMPASGVSFSFEAVNFIDANQSILGSKMGSSNLQSDVKTLLDLHQANKLELANLVSATYPLNDINDALDATRRGIGLRNVITM